MTAIRWVVAMVALQGCVGSSCRFSISGQAGGARDAGPPAHASLPEDPPADQASRLDPCCSIEWPLPPQSAIAGIANEVGEFGQEVEAAYDVVSQNVVQDATLFEASPRFERALAAARACPIALAGILVESAYPEYYERLAFRVFEYNPRSHPQWDPAHGRNGIRRIWLLWWRANRHRYPNCDVTDP